MLMILKCVGRHFIYVLIQDTKGHHNTLYNRHYRVEASKLIENCTKLLISTDLLGLPTQTYQIMTGYLNMNDTQSSSCPQTGHSLFYNKVIYQML